MPTFISLSIGLDDLPSSEKIDEMMAATNEYVLWVTMFENLQKIFTEELEEISKPIEDQMKANLQFKMINFLNLKG